MIKVFADIKRKKLLAILITIIVFFVLGVVGYTVYQDKYASQNGPHDTQVENKSSGTTEESESSESSDSNSTKIPDRAKPGSESQTSNTPNSNSSTPGSNSNSGTSSGGSTPEVCYGPLTITVGGTYTGCYESASPSTHAVTIATTQPVTLSRMTIKHRGHGVFAQQYRANITIKDSTFIASQDSSPVEQLDVYLYRPTALVIEHNQFTNGHGLTINGNNDTTSPFRIRYNNFTNVGRYNSPTCCIGAIHTDKVLAPGGQIQWNRVTAEYGKSLTEDSFGIYLTNGSSGNPLDISHNLVNGVYPYSGNGSGFTGGAFDWADAGGSWIYGHDNTAVNYTNNGFMIPSGDHITHINSTAVYDGRAGINDSGPVVSSVFGAGFTTWNNPSYPVTTNATVTGNTSGHWRLNGSWERSDFYLPACSGCSYSGNTNLGTVNAAAEQVAVQAFEASVDAANITIGPRPVLGTWTERILAIGKRGSYTAGLTMLSVGVVYLLSVLLVRKISKSRND